jgi:probable phosphoglycerate mutase
MDAPLPPPDFARFLVLRHGQSEANVQGLIASAPAVAVTRFGLTEEGRAQVRRSVRAAVDAGVVPAGCRLVSSPLRRARESAEVAAAELGVPFTVDDRLRERAFGELDLGPDTAYDGVWANDREDPGHVRWGVESVQALQARVLGLLRELSQGPMSGPVLLCTHGDVASVLICSALGGSLCDHRLVGTMGNAEVRPLARS